MILATLMNCPHPRPVLTWLMCWTGLLAMTPHALADEWAVVMRDDKLRVEIDRSTIIPSDEGTKVAWGRVVMSPGEVGGAGFAIVKALNRYDCINRSFITIKRVYLDEDLLVLREESIDDPQTFSLTRNSVDERMWREVCRPPSVQDLARLAEEASRAGAAASASLKARTAGRTQPAERNVTRPAAAPESWVPPPPPTIEPPREAPRPAGQGRPEASGSGAGRPRAMESPAATETARPSEPTAPPAQATPTLRAAPGLVREPSSGSVPTPTPAPEPEPERVSPALVAPAAAEPAAASASLAAPRRSPQPVSAVAGWAYEGEAGPDAWGQMRPEWAACAQGREQSPIDLRQASKETLDDPVPDFRETQLRVSDTGRTLLVEVDEGQSVELDGVRYGLERFTFHHPSEIRIQGRASDMAVHFSLRSQDGRQLVLVVQLARSERANPVLQTLFDELPARGARLALAEPVDLGALLPSETAHYRFMGSLSEPPCTEGVLWVVMKQALPVSGRQVVDFAQRYGRNARPLQAINGREVKVSR